jgi:hypothetical protein
MGYISKTWLIALNIYRTPSNQAITHLRLCKTHLSHNHITPAMYLTTFHRHPLVKHQCQSMRSLEEAQAVERFRRSRQTDINPQLASQPNNLK